LVDDAVVPPETAIEIRDHVGLARDLGAAATAIKFDRAVLPRGTVLKLEMVWELPADEQHAALAKDMLFALLHALRRGEVLFGAAKSRGLGRIALKADPAIRQQDFLRRAGMLTVLRQGGTRVRFSPTQIDRRTPQIEIRIDWRPEGPVMVKAGYDGIAVDALPLVTGDADRISPVLPGSALKGALRSQAERILRTVLGIDTPQSDGKRTAFLQQLRDRRLELAHLLFGAPGERARRKPPAEEKPVAGASALRVDDVMLRQLLPRQDWEAIENATCPRAVVAVNTRRSNIVFEPAHHVRLLSAARRPK
jgi:CRISPR/Cas system CSM-associated protein Csm3 (group 7 of RAMP superfamily)